MTDIARLGLEIRSDGVVTGTKRLEGLERQARRTEGATERMGRAVMGAAGAFAAMAAATMGFRAVVSTLSGFETSMAAVAAITRATDGELKQLRDTAKELGATTEFSASQAADALKFLGMAGFQTADAISAIPAVLDLATAAQMDLARAADISSNIMSAFGIAATDAAKVADVLAAASSRANTDVNQLGDAMKYVGPVAAAMGISMNDSAAAIGVLSDAGIQGAMAGTGLRRVLSSLANATPQATAVLSDMGLSLKDLNPATNSIVDIVDRLAASGIDAAQALTIFGDRGGPAILALVENNAKLTELTNGLKGVDGEAKRMADTMRDQLGGDLKGLMSSLEGIIIQLGESGLTNALRGVIQGMTQMVRSLTGAVAGFTAFVTDVGEATGASEALGFIVNALASNMDVLAAAAIATAVLFAGRYAIALGTTAVQATVAAVTASIRLQMALGATSTAAALSSIAMKGFTLSIGMLRTAITVLLGPVGIAIAIIGSLTAAMVMSGRETQRMQAIQQEYTDRLDAANRAHDTARKRLEDFRKKTGEVKDKVDEATGSIARLTSVMNELSASKMFQFLADINKEYGLYAQVLQEVQGEQSKMGMEGEALLEAQGRMAREMTEVLGKQAEARLDLNKQIEIQAGLERELAQEMRRAQERAALTPSGIVQTAGIEAINRQLEAQGKIIGMARNEFSLYSAALEAIREAGIDAFAGGLFAEQQAAAEQAAEKVRETIASLRERLLIDSQVNDLQREIASNILKAGLAINDNSAGAREIRNITAQIYELDQQRTAEAEALKRTQAATDTIADLEREVRQLGELHAALRISDEEYMNVAEAIAIEDLVRRNGIEGMDAEIERIRELVRQRGFLTGAIDTIRGGDMGTGGGISETDRTRSRERFEGVTDSLAAANDNPATRLREQYDQQLKIVEEYEAAYTNVKAEADATRNALTEQYQQTQKQLMVSGLADGFGAMADVMRDSMGEQSATYKIMFGMHKAFVVAMAAMNIQKAISDGWATGSTIYEKVAAVGIIMSNMASIMSAVQSVSLGFQSGGYTGSGGVSQVAGVVHGQEFVAHAEATRRWRPQLEAMNAGTYRPANDNGGGGTVNVNVTVSVDDDGRIQAYVRNAQGQAVNAAVTISGQQTKAMMGAAQKEANQPRISARG